MKQCSERFNQAFATGSGGIVRQCACGITTFCTHYAVKNYYEEGELEGYYRDQSKHPRMFIGTDYEPSTLNISGLEVVIGCSCEMAYKCEQWIEAHARQLTAYLNARAKFIKAEAAKVKEVEL